MIAAGGSWERSMLVLEPLAEGAVGWSQSAEIRSPGEEEIISFSHCEKQETIPPLCNFDKLIPFCRKEKKSCKGQ